LLEIGSPADMKEKGKEWGKNNPLRFPTPGREKEGVGTPQDPGGEPILSLGLDIARGWWERGGSPLAMDLIRRWRGGLGRTSRGATEA